ncbi:hypothetical protein F4776DRAFT_669019 [Hypoxylon sp. NC0597]|nr:hypothetical protein F4776DRAFT_669019 [Hypoxylon sp. NC0597]
MGSIWGLKYYPRAKSVLSKYKVKEFFPFDLVSKKVTTVVESPRGERITCTKGAPLFVLKTVEEDHPIPLNVNGPIITSVRLYCRVTHATTCSHYPIGGGIDQDY